MKHLDILTISSLICFSLLMIISVNEARHEPNNDYWKSVMKDEEMPQALKRLYHYPDNSQDEAASSSVSTSTSTSNLLRTERFSNNFGSKSSFIIYHTLGDHPHDHDEQDNAHAAAATKAAKAKHHMKPYSAIHN